MGQVFAKAGELVTKIISRIRSKCGKNRSRPKRGDQKDVSSKSARTLEPEDSRKQVITIPDAHIVTIPEESEDKSNITHHIAQEVRSNLNNGVAPPPNLGNVRSKPKKRDKWIKHYCSSHRILLVGEGDFSFSACLAKAFGSASNIVATSLDPENFLRKHYRNAMSNVNYLVSMGCTVRHDLDATEMAKYPSLNCCRFDRIIFNFPWAGFFKDFPRETQLKFHRKLVRSFMKNAKEILEEDGEIHITHKSYGFYLEWNLEMLATQSGLVLLEDVEFYLRDYPGYSTKYGCGGNDHFNCFRSRTYKFGLK